MNTRFINKFNTFAHLFCFEAQRGQDECAAKFSTFTVLILTKPLLTPIQQSLLWNWLGTEFDTRKRQRLTNCPDKQIHNSELCLWVLKRCTWLWSNRHWYLFLGFRFRYLEIELIMKRLPNFLGQITLPHSLSPGSITEVKVLTFISSAKNLSNA